MSLLPVSALPSEEQVSPIRAGRVAQWGKASKTAWTQSLGPTWWKERTDSPSCPSTSKYVPFCLRGYMCVHAHTERYRQIDTYTHINLPNKQTNKHINTKYIKKFFWKLRLQCVLTEGGRQIQPPWSQGIAFLIPIPHNPQWLSWTKAFGWFHWIFVKQAGKVIAPLPSSFSLKRISPSHMMAGSRPQLSLQFPWLSWD